LNDVLIEERYKEMVTIIPVTRIEEVLEHALVPKDKETFEKKLCLMGKHMELPRISKA
jgi:Lon-like ATP-dependent protease